MPDAVDDHFRVDLWSHLPPDWQGIPLIHAPHDKGKWKEEGTRGRRCTRERREAAGSEVSSHRSSYQGTHRCCRCSPHPLTYLSALPRAPMQQQAQAVRATWGTSRGNGVDVRRAWERVREEERRLPVREVRVMYEFLAPAATLLATYI